ncbi:MAG TPA: ISL3 family transposase [Candidatus Saccharimonadales bacterium]|nr:ISL3 family transposase [Candidatus Saccharimonadales bacterium]
MRVTTAFKRLLDLPGVTVTDVDFHPAKVVVSLKLRRRHLRCPECSFTTRSRYDTRPVRSSWRHLDLGRWRLEVRAELRRLSCPDHGVRTEAVPFARAGAHFTRDFEDLVGWLATTMDKTALCRLVRVDWDSVGRIVERVMGSELDPRRLEHLFVVGVDEVSWRKGHSYLTLVSNHATARFVWGAEGKDAATLDSFFDDLGAQRAEAITAMSMDMGPAFEKSARAPGHATKAIICYDPFHVVQLVTNALDTVRRQVWQDLRRLPDKDAARRFKGARWALLKNPGDLTDDQAVTLRKLKRRGGDLWRAYALKEALRAVFAGDLSEDEVAMLLDRFCSRAQRSGLKPFVTAEKTIRKRKAGILAAVRLKINNARHEGLNRRVRLIVNRAYDFHSAKAALGLIMLTLGPIEHVLPYERVPAVDP